MSEKYKFYSENFKDLKKKKEDFENLSEKLESQLNRKTDECDVHIDTISKLKSDV